MLRVERLRIERIAEMVREVCNIGIPFSNSIDQTLEILGGKLEFGEPSKWGDSELVLQNEGEDAKFIIKVKPYKKDEKDVDEISYNRWKNFRIACQIGHLFLHTTYVETLQDEEKELLFKKGNSARQDVEAQAFAASIVMPTYEFTEEVWKHEENNRVDMQKVAEKFDVCLGMAKLRAEILELIVPWYHS